MSSKEGSPRLHLEEPHSVRSSLHISIGGSEESNTRVPPTTEVDRGKQPDEVHGETDRERDTGG